MNNGDDSKKGNRYYLGNMVSRQGKFGEYQQIWFDISNPQNQDGSPNPFYKGTLVLLKADGEQYVIKNASFSNPSKGNQERIGAIASVYVDLDNKHHAEKIDSNDDDDDSGNDQ